LDQIACWECRCLRPPERSLDIRLEAKVSSHARFDRGDDMPEYQIGARTFALAALAD
jgi:hypothetical protein